MAMCGDSIGLVIASFVPDVALGLVVAPMIVLPLMMFSGFFLNTDSTPAYFIWCMYLSPMKYAFTALVRIEFDGLPLRCTDGQLQQVLDPVSNQNNQTAVEFCPFPSGDAYLRTLNLESWLTVGACQACLGGMALGLTILAYFGLAFTSHVALSKTRPKLSGKAPPEAAKLVEAEVVAISAT